MNFEHAGQTAGAARTCANIFRRKGADGSVRVVHYWPNASVEYDLIKHDSAKSVTSPFSGHDGLEDSVLLVFNIGSRIAAKSATHVRIAAAAVTG